MAFLCPVRMRRDKKKATNANIERDIPLPTVVGMGRITGSSSIETLVRVGIEKEHGLSPDSKMVVLHDFTPCVDDELDVKRGQIVNILYRENDWVYVIGQDSRQEGFIPFSYCAPYNPQMELIKKKLPRDQNIIDMTESGPLLGGGDSKLLEQIDEIAQGGGSGGGTNGGGLSSLKNSQISLISEMECSPFHKEPSGRYIVLYTFIARDENDLSVERGEFVTVLNREDPDWYWIVRSDGQEGFIPAAFVYPADSVLQTQQKLINACSDPSGGGGGGGGGAGIGGVNNKPLSSDLTNAVAVLNLGANLNSLSLQQQQQQQQQQHSQHHQIPMTGGGGSGGAGDDMRYQGHGTELVMLYDYKAQAPDDLSVRRGDWIYADLNNQTVDGWLWAYAPKTRKYGFIPKAYARPPAMTSL